MSRRLSALTLDNLGDIPDPCRKCVVWELDPVAARRAAEAGDTAFEKEAWVSATLLQWGSCGRVAYVDDVPAGFVLYAPPSLVPRSVAFPTSPVSPDAVLLMTLRVLPDYRGAGLARMLIQAVAKDLSRRGVRAIEAFGLAFPSGAVDPRDVEAPHGVSSRHRPDDAPSGGAGRRGGARDAPETGAGSRDPGEDVGDVVPAESDPGVLSLVGDPGNVDLSAVTPEALTALFEGSAASQAFGPGSGVSQERTHQAEWSSSCLVPADMLLAVGFKTVRPHHRFPRLRLELKTTVSWREDVELAIERILGTVRAPALTSMRTASGPALPSLWARQDGVAQEDPS